LSILTVTITYPMDFPSRYILREIGLHGVIKKNEINYIIVKFLISSKNIFLDKHYLVKVLPSSLFGHLEVIVHFSIK
jgi:hypothetical protein